MKYGLLIYEEGRKIFNLGDYVQSLAAKQYLPRVDAYLSRERLAEYAGDDIKLIMNGWFTHSMDDWIPSEKIDPLFVSFHMNALAAPFLLTAKAVSYLKKHEPIGCRDHFTVQILRDKGIEAYFTGCLTLTLDHYAVEASERGSDVCIVDPLYNYSKIDKLRVWIRKILKGAAPHLSKPGGYLEELIDREFLNSARYATHALPSFQYSEEEKFALAEDCLKKYARAKLVITSRIHCALPCLALGAPVIFVNGFGAFADTCRFDGLLNLFNRIDINAQGDLKANFNLDGKINASTQVENPVQYASLTHALKERCRNFIVGS